MVAQRSHIVCENPPTKCPACSGVAMTPDQPGPPWEEPLIVSGCAILKVLGSIGKALLGSRNSHLMPQCPVVFGTSPSV